MVLRENAIQANLMRWTILGALCVEATIAKIAQTQQQRRALSPHDLNQR
jgi:hypothetical protein